MCPDTEYRGVDDGVDASVCQAADRQAKLLGGRDHVAGAKGSHQIFVTRPYDRDRPQALEGGELQYEATDTAGGAGDEQGLTARQSSQIDGAVCG